MGADQSAGRRTVVKRPYRATAARVAWALWFAPKASSSEIGRALGLDPAYVRAAIRRSGLRLAMSRPYRGEKRGLYFSPDPGL